MQYLTVTFRGSVDSARKLVAIFGAGVLGIIPYITGYQMTFSTTVLTSVASIIAMWFLILIAKLFLARGIVKRRNRPLKLWSEDPFYEVIENENILDQRAGIELENISDIPARHCKLQIARINPTITNIYVPIFICEYLSIPGGKHERILIARFIKPKAPNIASQFRFCVPVTPGFGGGQFLLPENSYDITIEASCDGAEKNQVNCRLFVDERNTLRLSENGTS